MWKSYVKIHLNSNVFSKDFHKHLLSLLFWALTFPLQHFSNFTLIQFPVLTSNRLRAELTQVGPTTSSIIEHIFYSLTTRNRTWVKVFIWSKFTPSPPPPSLYLRRFWYPYHVCTQVPIRRTSSNKNMKKVPLSRNLLQSWISNLSWQAMMFPHEEFQFNFCNCNVLKSRITCHSGFFLLWIRAVNTLSLSSNLQKNHNHQLSGSLPPGSDDHSTNKKLKQEPRV